MSRAESWVTAVITDAKAVHPLVTGVVSTWMENLLTGELRERQLTKTELTEIAKQLLNDMVPAPPVQETKQ
mgnify:CR=1 FL=1